MHGHDSSAMGTDVTERLKTGELKHFLSKYWVHILLRPDTDLETNIMDNDFSLWRVACSFQNQRHLSPPCSHAKVCTLKNCHCSMDPEHLAR